jgi:N-acetylmuramoyl-L-alanine amidase
MFSFPWAQPIGCAQDLLLESSLISSLFIDAMKTVKILLFLVILQSLNLSFVQSKDSLFLRIVLPERDTVSTFGARYRYAASTSTLAKAFADGKESKIYPSGAFVGLLNIERDTTLHRLVVYSPTGDSLWKDFVFIRPQPMKNSPRDTLTIETAMMQPAEDVWLTKNDILEVRFKGSPGWRGSFAIDGVESGIPMRELVPRDAAGLSGVYVGRYQIKEADESVGKPVEFKLKKSFWSSENIYSKARVWIVNDSLPRAAEVTGRRPFLNAGLGTDRLGGAKLGYVVPGVLVTITGKVGGQYRVRLSEEMEAWIPEENVKLLPPTAPLPQSLTSSISVTGNSTEDVVLLPLTQKLPYVSEQSVSPVAITVDVFGATANTNWITQHLSAQGIESVKWIQVAADRFRLTIALKYAQHWGYDIDYQGTTLRVRVRRPPVIANPDSALRRLTIAVDAGHGGENHGALGATGVREMDLTLAIVQKVDSILRAKGANTILTRIDTTGPSMVERWEKILNAKAQLLVSVHCNSTGETSDPLATQGNGCFYKYIGFKPLADTMYASVLQTGLKQFGVTGSFNFSLNGPTQLPNVLVETAFLSHPEDEMLLIEDSFRVKLAQRIVSGLESFVRAFGERKITPETLQQQ